MGEDALTSIQARHYSDKGPCGQTRLSLTPRGITFTEKNIWKTEKTVRILNLEGLGMRRINEYF